MPEGTTAWNPTRRPALAGLLVPGMPESAPSMDEGQPHQPYEVLALDRDGKLTTYAQWQRRALLPGSRALRDAGLFGEGNPLDPACRRGERRERKSRIPNRQTSQVIRYADLIDVSGGNQNGEDRHRVPRRMGQALDRASELGDRRGADRWGSIIPQQTYGNRQVPRL